VQDRCSSLGIKTISFMRIVKRQRYATPVRRRKPANVQAF